MRSRNLIASLLIVGLILAGCGSRDGSATEGGQPEPSSGQVGAPPDGTLSDEAAAAFSELPPVELSENGGLRTFQIDPSLSKAAYIVDEEFFADATSKYGLEVGKYKVAGETQDVAGMIQLDLSGAAVGPNRFAVYLPTLQTDQKLRDGWIRENALESDKFPLALFVAEEIRDAPQGYQEGDTAHFQLEGELNLRGAALTAVWDVSARLQDGAIEGSMETRLRMTELGFDPPNFANTLTVQDEFTIHIDFVASER